MTSCRQLLSSATADSVLTVSNLWLQLQGSPSSGRDVTVLIEGQKPAAVVLELCASRFKSLNREITQVTCLHNTVTGAVFLLRTLIY
jgi:hypothetical protein